MKSVLKTTHGKNGAANLMAVFDKQDEALFSATTSVRKLWESYDDFVRRYAPDLTKPVRPARDYTRVDVDVTFFLTKVLPLGEALERRQVCKAALEGKGP